MTIIVDFPILQIVNIVRPHSLLLLSSRLKRESQLNGIITITWEWPLPWIKDTALYRSFAARVAFYLFCGVIASASFSLLSQYLLTKNDKCFRTRRSTRAFSTPSPPLFSQRRSGASCEVCDLRRGVLIATPSLGEVMEEAKANRGKGGQV